jgi:hypothetical protein
VLKVKKQPLFEKSGAKTFCYYGPGAVKPHGPKTTKFFCFFLFTKRSAFFLLRERALRVSLANFSAPLIFLGETLSHAPFTALSPLRPNRHSAGFHATARGSTA